MAQVVNERQSAAERHERLQDLIARRQLDAIVVSSLQNVTYFGGAYIMTQLLVPDRLAFVVAPRGGAPVALVCDIEESLVRGEGTIDDVRIYVEFHEDPVAVLAELLRESGVEHGTVGLDARRLGAGFFLSLQHALPGATFVPLDDEIEELQMRKDEAEIAGLTAAAQSMQAAIETGFSATALPATELELAAEIYAAVARDGGVPCFLVLGAAERSAIAHADPLPRVLREGSVVRVDAGARYAGGLFADVARMGVVGAPAPEQEETLAALRRCQDAAIALMEPGRPVRELFDVCRASFERERLPFLMPHIGHGLGVGLHEPPRVHPAADTLLEAGMVINIEPLTIIEARREAYHVEDLVLVTADGPRLLTTPQDRLLRVGGAS